MVTEQTSSRDGITDELTDSIETTVKSEQELLDYVKQERKRRREKEVKKLNNSSHKEIGSDSEDMTNKEFLEFDDTDPELDSHTARIKQIKFKSHSKKLKITFEDCEGEEHSDTVSAGLPEDTNNKYVRLSNLVGADPVHPTELRGEIIPVQNTDDSVEIDYPPVMKRLNPVAFRSKRLLSRFSSFVSSKYWLATPLKYLLTVFGSLLPAIGFIGSFVSLVWASEVTRNGAAIHVEVFAHLLIIPLIIIMLGSAFVAFHVYGRILLYGLIDGLCKIGSGIKRVYRFLFPSAN